MVWRAWVLVLLIPASALAQRPLHTDEWTVLAARHLAQACVAEAGFDSGATGERAAIGWVYARRFYLRRIAGNYTSFAALIWRENPSVRMSRRSWIRNLRADERPRGMPHHWPWDRLLPKWLQIRHLVQEWSNGLVPNPCPTANLFTPPNTPPPPGSTRVQCTIQTRNHYWRVPGP
jgi:hypothetical protein